MVCKELLGTWQIQVLFFGTSWNFYFPNTFDLWLAESVDVEPADTEGQLYSDPFADQQWLRHLYVISSSQPPWEGYRTSSISSNLQMRRLRSWWGEVTCPSHTVG